MASSPELPVAVIGAGPVGLAAAAHLVSRGIRPIIFERGDTVGRSLLEWGHVRVFSPWVYNIDAAARTLLEQTGWRAPEDGTLPTGSDIMREYLAPLAELPQIAPNLRLGATVTAVTREGLDKESSGNRDEAPFVVRVVSEDGREERLLARAVIDASGTWTQPNPLGVDGLPVNGEAAASNLIDYGIPDVVGKRRTDFADKRVLVVGGGHSAINVALALMELRHASPRTEIFWALRRAGVTRLLGGGLNDKLPERGALGLTAEQAMEDGRLNMLTLFAIRQVTQIEDGLMVDAMQAGERYSMTVDR
ncbi:MAG: NAD(P)-binding domain-containing protein, partial [Pararhizobium sp.]